MTEDRRTQTGIEVKIDYIIERVKEIENKLEHNYVSQDEFRPVKAIAFGMVALILTSVVGALLTLILIK